MASLSIEIKITMERRPCVVYNGSEPRKALCHLFTTRAFVLGPSPLKGGHMGGQVSEPVAVVEFEDGTVETVTPSHVRFLDTRAEMDQYDWKMRPNPEGAE